MMDSLNLTIEILESNFKASLIYIKSNSNKTIILF